MAEFDIDGARPPARASKATTRATDPARSARAPDAPARGPRPGNDAASLLSLQRSVGNAGVIQRLRDGDPEAQEAEAASPVLGVVGKGGGSRLPDPTRQGMEARFGQSFADVRIHTGGAAADSARHVDASAYTVGNEIVFAEGRYDPASAPGQRTLAHELAHVVQQRSGPVDGSDLGGGVRVSHPSDRFERAAEHTASRVAGGEAVGSTASAPRAAVAQREMEETEEKDEVAGAVAQRQAEAAGEEPLEEEEEEGGGPVAQRQQPAEGEEPLEEETAAP